jgi:hypothetical protein
VTYQVQECCTEICRILMLTADTAEELAALREKAAQKGWADYFEGTEPESGRPAAWLKKAVADPG